MEKSTLDWIINPIKSDDFLENYYEKKHLLINRNNPNYYQDVLSFDEINNLINTQTLVYPDCRLIDSKRDEPLDSSLYTLSNNNLIDSIKFLRLFSEEPVEHLRRLHPGLMMDCLISLQFYQIHQCILCHALPSQHHNRLPEED